MQTSGGSSTNFDVVIYQLPSSLLAQRTSELIRRTGIEPHLIDFAHCPPTKTLMYQLLKRMHPRPVSLLGSQMIPSNRTAHGEIEDAMIDKLLAYPHLLAAPIVATPKGVCLCLPPENVVGILPIVKHTSDKRGPGNRNLNGITPLQQHVLDHIAGVLAYRKKRAGGTFYVLDGVDVSLQVSALHREKLIRPSETGVPLFESAIIVSSNCREVAVHSAS